MQPAVVAPKPAAVTADMMAIVPAPVLDTRAGVFVGTGDSSNGVWVKP
jgi:hypothetical protein